jgi:hypothetical protein
VRLLTNRCYIDGIIFRLVRTFAAFYWGSLIDAKNFAF